jgi:hypothetical protein
MRKITTTIVAVTALATVAALTPSATAQADDLGDVVQPANGPTGTDWQFIIRGGGGYDFETDLDGGGDVSAWAARFGFEARKRVSDQFSFAIVTGIEHISYDFGGNQGFAALDPWDDVEIFGAALVLNWRLDDQWSLSGGPLFQAAWESGADADDGIQAGGVFAASYKVSDTLTIGGGFGVISQIEDDALAFPVLVIDWQINDQWSLESRRESGAGPFSGTELIWDCAEDWELGLGFNFRQEQRFRLDDDPVAPDGVGRTRFWPVWVRAGWKPTPNVSVDGFVGVLLGGELLLEDDDGKRIADDDVDPMPAIGLTGRIRF